MADKIINNIKLPNGEIYKIGGTGSGGGLPMFSPIWSDHLYNDASYLRADTFSWHSGAIYVTGYNILLEEYSSENCIEEISNGITYKRTPSGFKIADVEQQDNIIDAYENNGIAWYYVIDIENRRFKLPRTKYGFTGIRNDAGNDVEAGLPTLITNTESGHTHTRGTMNITGSVTSDDGNYYWGAGTTARGAFSNARTGGSHIGSDAWSGSRGNGFNFDASQTWEGETSEEGEHSHTIEGNSDTVQTPATQMYLYFYVGDYKRPKTEVNVGEISEALNDKVDLNGGNYEGSELEKYIRDNISGSVEIGDIGIAPLGIDESEGKRRYLNGQIIIQEHYVKFTEKLKSAVVLYPSLVCTEDEWQTAVAMSGVGQCGKFVIDDENGTIRLPKIVMPIQGLTDLSKLAEIVEAGLPNITGYGTATPLPNHEETNYYGALYKYSTGGGYGNTTSGSYNRFNIGFDASRSNPIYGNSATVQPEAIQYPYFIQVATGSVTVNNITNEIELNNPYSLLDVRWSDKLLNNISWLRSEGQPNARSNYNDVYELLLREYNSASDTTETINDISIVFRRGAETNIKVTTDKTAYDSILASTGTAWYYVIDIENETFYLPQTNGFFQFGGTGEFVEAGLPNITGSVSVFADGAENASDSALIKNGSGGTSIVGTNADLRRVIGLDASRSNPIYGKSDTVQPNAVKGYLYFYVGETVQNANLINAGRMGEKMVDLLAKPHITETYQNGTSWYRVYSDGWCEQGGYASMNVTSITFLKPFVDTNYTLTGSIDQNVNSAPYWTDFGFNRTATGFSLRMGLFSWQASGYIA